MLYVYAFLCLAQIISLLYIGWVNHKQYKLEKEFLESQIRAQQQLQELRTKKG